MNVLNQAMIAIRSIFRPQNYYNATASTEANTQAIMASADSIKRRADEFSRLVHGQRGDLLPTKRQPRKADTK